MPWLRLSQHQLRVECTGFYDGDPRVLYNPDTGEVRIEYQGQYVSIGTISRHIRSVRDQLQLLANHLAWSGDHLFEDVP